MSTDNPIMKSFDLVVVEPDLRKRAKTFLRSLRHPHGSIMARFLWPNATAEHVSEARQTLLRIKKTRTR